MLELKNQTISSREIAEITGKRHDNVLRDCEKLNESYLELSLLKIEEGIYTHQKTGSQEHKQMLLNKMQCMDLMTGYNLELRIKVNRRWEELENESKTIDFSKPENVLQLVKNWAETDKKRIEAENKVKKLQPKADFVDKVFDMDEKIDVGQAAKILELPFGRNTLFKKLREHGVFFANKNEPKQEYINKGYFQVKEKMIDRANHDSFLVLKILVTQKGLAFLSKVFNVIQTPKQTLSIN